MKKETIFKHELNESIQANAAMNCLKNRNNHKQMNESSDFDKMFQYRSDLRELGTPITKEAYMIIYNEFGDSMWRQLGIADCNHRGLLDMLSDYQKYFNINNPQDLANKMLGRKATEQEETVDIPQLAEDVVASYRGRLSKMDEKERVNFISTMVMKKMGKSIDTLTPQEKKEIIAAAKHSMWYVSEQEESTGDDKFAIAKQVMANYNPETDEYEDPMVWLRYAIQEQIGKQFLYLPKKEVKAWQKAIEATIDEYEVKKRVEELKKQQEEHSEDADRVQSQLADAWDDGMEDDEDDYVPYENKFDETHHDIVDTILDEVYRYFEFETDVEGFNIMEYTEEQIGKAIEQILDKTGDFPSSVNNNVCYAWVKKHAEEIIKALENGSLENSYEGHPEFDFSEQEEMEVTDAKHALAQLAAELLRYDDGDLDELYYAISDIIDSEGYCPQSDEYEMWIEEHVNEIEDLIM